MSDGKMELSGPSAGIWQPENETPAGAFERLAKTATGWGKCVCELTLWGLEGRDSAGNNRMPEAYDKLMTAAHEWGRPQAEIDGFAEAKAIVLRVRQLKTERSPQRGHRKGTKVTPK